MEKPKEWYSDFMQTTGFGVKSMFASNKPENPGHQERRFENQYKASESQRYPAQGVPGTIPGAPPLVPGQMAPQDALQQHIYSTPYPEGDVVLNKDGTKRIGPTEQQYYQAVGVGRMEPTSILKNPASQYIPGGKRTGGFQLNNQTGDGGTNMQGSVEKMEGTNMTMLRGYQAAAIFFGGISVLAGIKFAASKEKSWAYAAVLSLCIGTAGLILFIIENNKSSAAPEYQKGKGARGYMADGRKILMDTNFSPPYDPFQRDQYNDKVYQQPPDPEDTFGNRLRYQDTNTETLEGPRAQLGYRRSPVTPDGRKPLAANRLMRQPGNYNMDDGTFTEYMRRLNGEAPNQFYQAHPLYTFNAEWDNRPQINDASHH